MKKTYTEPQVEVVMIEETDIIVTSTDCPQDISPWG